LISISRADTFSSWGDAFHWLGSVLGDAFAWMDAVINVQAWMAAVDNCEPRFCLNSFRVALLALPLDWPSN
jgi:hypothetical protein